MQGSWGAGVHGSLRRMGAGERLDQWKGQDLRDIPDADGLGTGVRNSPERVAVDRNSDSSNLIKRRRGNP